MKHSLRTSLVPLAAALVLALVAAPLLAADAPAAAPQGPVAGYLRCLGVVGLTDVQKADVKALLEAAKPKLDALHATRKADREALHAAIAAATPDPCAIGAALLKVEADTKAIGAELKTLFTAVEALLTPEQKAKLEGCLKAPKPNAAEGEGEED
ncbi:MAG: periplasmic heavy metal sensor [Thermoanaerobaculia bacterium]